MSRAVAGVAVILFCTVIAARPSFAQCSATGAPASCGVPGSVSMTAGRVVRLQMSAGSTSLTAPTPDDFDARTNATAGPSLSISANAPCTLHIRAATAVCNATSTSPGEPARANKPAADLMWSTAPSGSFAALTTSDASLIGGAATVNDATTLYFQTLYNWTLDTPGNYSLSIVLTLTAP